MLKNSNPLPLHLIHDQVKKKKKKKKKKLDFFPTISVSTVLFGFPHLFSDTFVNKALLYAVFASEILSNVLFINKVLLSLLLSTLCFGFQIFFSKSLYYT
jgi:hypothetical protein